MAYTSLMEASACRATTPHRRGIRRQPHRLESLTGMEVAEVNITGNDVTFPSE
ncbi:MAG TPA: hypothetical protein VK869_00470 [Rubrobacteraceae bacterium]|nr:hypothetical protein [Rubrobacteraceae bacterium]